MKVLLWLVILIIFFLVWTRYVERHNIYFPMKEIYATPEAVGLAYEEVYLKTSDNKRLYGWFIPNDRAELTVLFFHGNGGNLSHRLEKLAFLHNLALNAFIPSYRGYGKSEGTPSESGLYKDAEAAYDYLTEKHGIPGNTIVLYGESLGGAVAIDLAVRKKVRALITEEAFTSIADMTKVVYPFIPPFIIATKFDSASKIVNVTCPKLIIHSRDDEIVPFYLGEKLFGAALPPKKFFKTRGSHNTAFFDSTGEFRKEITSFLGGV